LATKDSRKCSNPTKMNRKMPPAPRDGQGVETGPIDDLHPEGVAIEHLESEQGAKAIHLISAALPQQAKARLAMANDPVPPTALEIGVDLAPEGQAVDQAVERAAGEALVRAAVRPVAAHTLLVPPVATADRSSDPEKIDLGSAPDVDLHAPAAAPHTEHDAAQVAQVAQRADQVATDDQQEDRVGRGDQREDQAAKGDLLAVLPEEVDRGASQVANASADPAVENPSRKSDDLNSIRFSFSR
jgi:hypothetical protein